MRSRAWVTLLLYTIVAQVDLYLDTVNTVARRIPSLLVCATSTLFFVFLSKEPPEGKTLGLYSYLTLTTLSIVYRNIIVLLHTTTSSIDLFARVYSFPLWLCWCSIVAGCICYFVAPLVMLLSPSHRIRIVSALLLLSFNTFDVALFEAYQELDPCYRTVHNLYINVLFGVLLYVTIAQKQSPLQVLWENYMKAATHLSSNVLVISVRG
jgi:hypothetical protein